MKLKAMREAAPSAEDIFAAYRAARQELARRRDQYLEKNTRHLEMAARDLARAARDLELPSSARVASQKARHELAERLDPRPRQARGGGRLGLLVLALGVGAAVGYLVADRKNRERMTEYARGLTERARPVVEDVVSKVRNGSQRQDAEEAAILAEVQGLLAGEAVDEARGIRATAEGRTVYLRGEAAPETARQLADRIRELPGVAAVVNLTMTASASGPPRAEQPAAQTSS